MREAMTWACPPSPKIRARFLLIAYLYDKLPGQCLAVALPRQRTGRLHTVGRHFARVYAKNERVTGVTIGKVEDVPIHRGSFQRPVPSDAELLRELMDENSLADVVDEGISREIQKVDSVEVLVRV